MVHEEFAHSGVPARYLTQSDEMVVTNSRQSILFFLPYFPRYTRESSEVTLGLNILYPVVFRVLEVGSPSVGSEKGGSMGKRRLKDTKTKSLQQNVNQGDLDGFFGHLI